MNNSKIKSKKESNKELKNNTIKSVLHLIGKHKIHAALSLLFALLTVAFTLYVPILTGKSIDYMIEGDTDWKNIKKIIITIAVLVVLTIILQWIMNVINTKMTYAVVKDIRAKAIRKLQNVPLAYLDTQTQGDLVSRVIADVDQFADGLLLGFAQFFTGVMTIIGTLLFMISINIKITLVVVLVTPLSFFVASFISKKTYSMFTKATLKRGEQTGFIDEMIGNLKVVKAYTHEDEAIKQFDKLNDDLAKYSLKALFYSSLTNPSTRFVNGLVYAGVGVFGAILIVTTGGVGLTVGQLSSFLSYANQYTKPFNEISSVITELQNAIACAQRIFEFLEAPEIEKDLPDAITLSEAKGDVTFDDVSFSYLPEQRLIEHFNLDVKAGSRIAIVGPTGCGKTTLINLLMRFYDPVEGRILIDGHENNHITMQSLRHSFGMVLQETWLKNATVRENIAMGKPDATDEEIIAAAKAAHSHSFIKRLPKGYDTLIGEELGGLSQGQKQLLCITRVMLCLPPMLILDEATSSIDTITERRIQKAFLKLMEGRTSFVVAHRLSTIKESDVILVMKDGNVIEQGSHDELIVQKGFYYNLYNSQFN